MIGFVSINICGEMLLENAADYKIQSVIYFFKRLKLVKLADIHRELVSVYKPHVMKEGKVWKLSRLFNSGRTLFHDES